MFMSENKPLDRDVSCQIMVTHGTCLASLPVCLLNIFPQLSGWHLQKASCPPQDHCEPV